MDSAYVSWLQPGFTPPPPCIFWVPNCTEQERVPAREAGEREGKEQQGSTLASTHTSFFQCPLRSFHFSYILIFASCLLVQFSIASLMLVDSHPWWGKPLSSASPDRQSPSQALTTPFQALLTLPGEEPGAKRVSAWTAPSMCPFDADAAQLLVAPAGRYSGGCWERSRSGVPVQQRSPSSSLPRVSPSRFLAHFPG